MPVTSPGHISRSPAGHIWTTQPGRVTCGAATALLLLPDLGVNPQGSLANETGMFLKADQEM